MGGIPTEDPPQADTLYASQTISIAASPVYKPSLELNTTNDLSGDLIQGGYVASASHVEPGSYSRSDFDLTGQDAFLTRLRRTGETATSGISSSGPPVPFLFGHFAIGAEGSDPATLNRRRARGTLVRATGIANASPALTVGVSLDVDGDGVADPNREGVASFWLEQAAWTAAPPGTLTIAIAPNGSITGDVSGHFVANEVTPRQVARVGDALPAIQTAPADLELGRRRFVPLYENVGGTMLVVGFGVAILDSATSVQKLPGLIAPENASNALTSPSSVLTAAQWSQLFTLQATILDSLVKAPARVRAIP